MRALLITATRLGDAVLSTGAVSYLAKRYPGAELVVACGGLPASLFEAMPEVAEVWPIAKQPRAGHWRALWRRAVGRRWTHIVDLRGSAFTYTVLTRRRSILQPDRALRHRVLHLTQTLGADAPLAPRLCWSEADMAEARRRMGAAGPWLAIGPTANWQGKIWPPERFGAVAKALVGPDGPLAGARVLIPGAPGEERMAEPVFAALRAHRPVAAFGWPLPVLAAALASARLYIGNDSGLMHMAAAVGTPTIGLFGPSRAELYAPWGEHTAVVQTQTSFDDFISAPGYNRFTTGSLMGEITVNAVLAAARRLWESAS
jgi:heptosyltransferase III